jgi:hypothetical protein
MLAQYVQKVNEVLEINPDAMFQAQACSVGGGEWSIEVSYFEEESNIFLFELIGSNGTLQDEPADDLWAEYVKIMREAGLNA